MSPTGRQVRVACRRCGYRARRKLKAGDERSLETLNRTLRCGNCGARACNGHLDTKEVQSSFAGVRGPKLRRARPRSAWSEPDAATPSAAWPPDNGAARTARLPGDLLARLVIAVVAIVPVTAAVGLLCVAVYLAAVVLQVAGRTVFRAIDYEVADNVRHSPRGGYYDRNGGGYHRPAGD